MHKVGLIGAVMGAVILAAPAALAAEPQPVSGGTLVFGINAGDPPTYDCHQSTVFAIIHLLTPHYSSILRIDTAHFYATQISPQAEGLAESAVSGYVAAGLETVL